MKQRDFDIQSNDNTLFCTSQCNNRCVMCCQPPASIDDIERLFEENLQRVRTAPKDLPLIGITGGEPTLLGEKLITLIREIRECLPDTEIQLLSNGRRFADIEYARKLASVGCGKLYVGTELHSDYYKDHDIIAGVNGAYKETLKGMYNLTSCGVPIELRIIMCAFNYRRLYNIAEFIHRNLPFVGWYQQELLEAIKYLADWNYNVNIFNIPLCLLPSYLHDYARKSISDWKNCYAPICEHCKQKSGCCGFFTTSRQYFVGINPL